MVGTPGGWADPGDGLVTLGQAESILLETQDALVLLVGMMALSAIAEKAGFFDWAASLIARAGGGSVLRLYGFVVLAGTLITATLSLDAMAIVLTPIFYGMVVRLRLSPMPFMFACVYTANTASLFLPISNLTNLLAYNAFDLEFTRFALIMLIPATLAILANDLILAGLFRKDLRGSYEQNLPSFVPENQRFFQMATGGIAGVLVAFFLASIFGIPIGLVGLTAGALLVFVARFRGWMALREVAGNISWSILALVIGLFLVVQWVENGGLASAVRRAFAAVDPGDGFLQILGRAVGSALGSNLINNVPMIVLALGATEPLVSKGTLGFASVYAVILGTNIGPNLTTVGSLATLIWLTIIRGKGMDVTARDYLKVGAISTPVILLVAALGLWISLEVFGG